MKEKAVRIRECVFVQTQELAIVGDTDKQVPAAGNNLAYPYGSYSVSVMRISKKSEYALRALIAIGRNPQAQLHQIHELSAKENIPVKFLEQILLALRHGGILTSKRGVKGGYSFARKPDAVSIGEVIRLMDGPIAPVACTATQPAEECSCPDKNNCALKSLMTDVRAEIVALLDNRTIDDVIQRCPQTGPIEFMI